MVQGKVTACTSQSQCKVLVLYDFHSSPLSAASFAKTITKETNIKSVKILEKPPWRCSSKLICWPFPSKAPYAPRRAQADIGLEKQLPCQGNTQRPLGKHSLPSFSSWLALFIFSPFFSHLSFIQQHKCAPTCDEIGMCIQFSFFLSSSGPTYTALREATNSVTVFE